MKKRAQFVFNKAMVQTIKNLKRDYGTSSQAQAIRNAAVLAEYINKCIKNGYKIQAVKDGEETKELVISLAG